MDCFGLFRGGDKVDLRQQGDSPAFSYFRCPSTELWSENGVAHADDRFEAVPVLCEELFHGHWYVVPCAGCPVRGEHDHERAPVVLAEGHTAEPVPGVSGCAGCGVVQQLQRLPLQVLPQGLENVRCDGEELLQQHPGQLLDLSVRVWLDAPVDDLVPGPQVACDNDLGFDHVG